MPRKKPTNLRVAYGADGKIDVELELSRLIPRRGKGFRSVVYFDGKVKAAGMVAHVKLWRPVTKTQRSSILKQFHKNMVAAKSPKII